MPLSCSRLPEARSTETRPPCRLPEDRLPAPLAPYGASKWASEAYVLTWAASSELPHAVCRLGNVYGPRQSPHGEAGVVSILSHHLWSDRRPTLFGFGKPTRDYVEVSDVAAALLKSAGTKGIFNIATGIETSVDDLYTQLQDVAGKHITPEARPTARWRASPELHGPDPRSRNH